MQALGSMCAVMCVFVFGGSLMAVRQSSDAAPTDKVTITGLALSMSNVATGSNETIRININRWTPPDARKHLIATFLEKSQDDLRRELERQPELGRFSFPGYVGADPNNVMRLGTEIRYAVSHPAANGGRRIIVITPRVIGFAESVDQPRTHDYPFSFFEMRFDSAGKGEGRMAYATQIRFDKETNTIDLEWFSTEPVRLRDLELEVRK